MAHALTNYNGVQIVTPEVDLSADRQALNGNFRLLADFADVGVRNPMTSNLDAGGFDITDIETLAAIEVGVTGPMTNLAGAFDGGNAVTAAFGVLPSGSAAASVSVWFKMSDSSDTNMEIAGWGSNSYTGARFGVWIGSGTLGLETQGISSLANWTPDTNWHHLVITYPSAGSGSDVLIYLDNDLLALSSSSAAPNIDASGQLATAAVPEAFGSDNFSGLVQELQIYDAVITSAQVNELWNAGAGFYGIPSDLAGNAVAGYHLNGNADDFVGTSNGTWIGAPDYADGIVGGSTPSTHYFSYDNGLLFDGLPLTAAPTLTAVLTAGGNAGGFGITNLGAGTGDTALSANANSYTYLDGGAISTDGTGNVAIAPLGGGYGVPGLLIDGLNYSADTCVLAVRNGATSLDGGAITTDGTGGLQIANSDSAVTSAYALTVTNSGETGGTSLDDGAITTNGSGIATFGSKAVLALLHFDVFPFIDEAGNTVTAFGSVSLNSSITEFGSAGSLYNDGTSGNALTISGSNVAAGNGDFTAECFVYPLSPGGAVQAIYDGRRGAPYYDDGLVMYIGSDGLLHADYNYVLLTGSSGPSATTWSHVVLMRSAGAVYLGLNGNWVGSTSFATALPNETFNLSAACDLTANLSGYLDEFRLSSIAQYDPSSPYTVPAAPFSYMTNSVTIGGSTTLAVVGATSLDDGAIDTDGAGNLTLNSGLFFPQQAPTASAPAYVKGGMYFDTTLNKLRIGGATDWETVTSI